MTGHNKYTGLAVRVTMEPMQSVLARLTVRGFVTQFKATRRGLLSLNTRQKFQPRDMTVVGIYRFEGESNPDDSAILYVVRTMTGEQGTLVDAYGLYHDAEVTDFMQHVKVDSNHSMLD